MYDTFVYHLDLCILAYQLYNQTLIWPLDPYYEQLISPGALMNDESRRQGFMGEVRKKFQPPFTQNPIHSNALIHGPGSCIGWPANNLLDPIVSEYRRINPWRPSFVRPNRENEPWIVYNTPKEITHPINAVYMVQYDDQNGPYAKAPQVKVQSIYSNHPSGLVTSVQQPTDLLYCFEGGTGAIGGTTDERQYASWSMMGFVLARTVSQAELGATVASGPLPYDVHIVFRGSRSGDVRAKESVWQERGNPDWASNMDFFELVEDQEISQTGRVCRGFRTSVKTMLSTIMKCLEEVHIAKGTAPRKIYVTGHSLGGALACHFAIAMMKGTIRPLGRIMSDGVKRWPWDNMELITFGAPVVGDRILQESFNAALPSSRRIWLAGDPITQKQIHYPVGQPYEIPHNMGSLPSTTYHEPYLIRRFLIRDLQTERRSLTNVPANTGQEDLDEPWKLFNTCQEMLQHLGQVNRGNIQECFPLFVHNLAIYFEALKLALPKGTNSAIAVMTQEVQAAVDPDLVTREDLHRNMNRWIANMKSIDSDLHAFFILCLVLAFLLNSNADLPTTRLWLNSLKAEEAFKELTKLL